MEKIIKITVSFQYYFFNCALTRSLWLLKKMYNQAAVKSRVIENKINFFFSSSFTTSAWEFVGLGFLKMQKTHRNGVVYAQLTLLMHSNNVQFGVLELFHELFIMGIAKFLIFIIPSLKFFSLAFVEIPLTDYSATGDVTAYQTLTEPYYTQPSLRKEKSH